MCTVTFVPLKGAAYYLTSNRDEHIARPVSIIPKIEKFNTYELIYPKDPKGGGTWIATNNLGTTVCLLNGANQPHLPSYPYRHSRGLIVLDFFKFNDLQDFIQFYELDNIEPFTLVIVTNDLLHEFKWDGKVKGFKDYRRDEPRIWSSVTLYNQETIKLREKWFKDWLKNHPDPDSGQMINFHKFTGDGNKSHNVLMERKEGLKTVSITSIFRQKEKISVYYEDLLKNVISSEYFANQAIYEN